jgi:hypothetical protein
MYGTSPNPDPSLTTVVRVAVVGRSRYTSLPDWDLLYRYRADVIVFVDVSMVFVLCWKLCLF